MIKVISRPEPADFDTKVRRKAASFFANRPLPISSKQWKNREFWTSALKDLYEAYGGICAYCAHWVPLDAGDPTVDHFTPKSLAPHLAYEWSNFRLACLRYNRNKQNYTDVLDPFTIESGWFILDFPSLQVLAARHSPDDLQQKINATITRLGLNKEPSIRSRKWWVMNYCQQEISYKFLRKNAPFIASEIERQGILADLPKIMGFA